jgi:AraC family transcriptional regulator, ethanolamine operon transcriptional activator
LLCKSGNNDWSILATGRKERTMETVTFHDFESFAASLQHVDLRIMLTYDRGQCWRTQQATLNRLSVHYGLEGGGIICEGAAQPDSMGLFVPMKHPEAITCNGLVCDDNCWMLQVPGREFCYNVTGPNEWASVFIPLDVWSELAIDLRRLPPNRLIQTAPPLTAKLREAIRRFMAIGHGSSRFLEIPSIIDSIEAELLSAIVSLVFANESKPAVAAGRPVIPRGDVIRVAKGVLDERPEVRPAAGSLAAAAGVSERTLRNIFRDYYGVAPLRYLKLRRLHFVRDALKQGNPERDTVTEIATHFGIGEIGRFAHDYRKLFGESPVQTLRGICV